MGRRQEQPIKARLATSESVSEQDNKPLNIGIARVSSSNATSEPQEDSRWVSTVCSPCFFKEISADYLCNSCKARKVKCDEGKPKCSACARHNVACEYTAPTPRRRSDISGPARSVVDPTMMPMPNGGVDQVQSPHAKLELRLMHQWTAYTSQSFSPSADFWKYEAPIMALDHRGLMEAIFALSALQVSRQAAPIGQRSSDSRMYWNGATSRHRNALAAPGKETLDASFLAGILLTLNVVFTLSDTEHDPALLPHDVTTWLRLADETSYLNDLRTQQSDNLSMYPAGITMSRHALLEEDQLFEQEQGRPFEALLTFAEDYEAMTTTDKSAYQAAVAFIALTYKGINEATLHPLEACYRLATMPMRLPKRFTEQIEMRTPRAMVILAHAFALMKLVSEQVPWLRGVAEVQVPLLQQQIPAAWNEMMKWPVAIAQGEMLRESVQTDIGTTLA